MKKRLWYLVLCALLLSTLMPAPTLAATAHQVGSPEELSTLLSGGTLKSGDTIKLIANIDYESPIVIDGMNITFDVGEYTLTITSTVVDSAALEVGPGGTVKLKRTTGALNIVTSSLYGNGVYTYEGGVATVTNVTVNTGYCWAAFADTNSVINITGDVTCTASSGARGLCAFGGGKVNVGGDVLVTGDEFSHGIMCGSRGAVHIDGSLQVQGDDSYGIDFEEADGTDQVDGTVQVDGGITVEGTYCYGVASDVSDSKFVVTGNIRASGDKGIGVEAVSFFGNTTVTVKGNVSTSGRICSGAESAYHGAVRVNGDISVEGDNSRGIGAYSGASSSVNGDITATGEDSVGAVATEDGVTTVNGNISAPLYVGVNVVDIAFEPFFITKTKEEGVPGTGAYANYLVYRDTEPPADSYGTGTVYVRLGGGGGSQPSGSRTLTDGATGIAVSGGGIRGGTQLIVQPLSLHDPCAACDAIRQSMADSDMTVLFEADLSLSRSYSGGLTITIPVGAQYNGQTLTLLHCYNGELETLTAVVQGGEAVFTVRGLSPIAVFAQDELDDIPKTGDSRFPWAWWLLCGASAAGMAILIGLYRRKLKQQ